MALTDKLTNIGNAIRAKTGGTALIPLADMPDEIASIETGTAQTDYAYSQINEDVDAYLEEVTYDPSDYTVSRIASYVKDTTHHRPAGCAFSSPVAGTLCITDGTAGISREVASGTNTVYNICPGKNSPYLVTTAQGEVKRFGMLTPSGSLRMIYLNDAANIRDLGGWGCDGGAIKYGKLFRGTRLFIRYSDGQTSVIDADDLRTLHDELSIRYELDLRYASDSGAAADFARGTSLIGDDVAWKHIDGSWYAINDKTKCKALLDVVMSCVVKETPLYFHCAGGADRTGTLAMWIEAILGVAQSDIDKDYELTCFYSGAANDAQARRRNESEWRGLISAFDSYPGSNLRDRVVAWVITLGIPIERINAFRMKMIDGTPAILTNPYGNAAVTANLTHISLSGEAQAPMYSPYTATLSADTGYSLSGATVSITMGGTDITSSCYDNGVISIPQVTGAVVITAAAASMYTNQILHATAAIGGTELYNDTGYKQDYRWNSSNVEDNGSISGVPNKFAVGYIHLKAGDVVHFYGDIIKGTSGGLTTHFQNASDTRLARATFLNWSQYTERPDLMEYMSNIDYDTANNILHSFKWTGGTNAVDGYMHVSCVGTFTEGVTVITINEEM